MEYINLFVNNHECFEEDIYSLIIQKLNLNLKSEIIDVIDILTKNKHKFRELNNIDSYNLIMKRLIYALENYEVDKVNNKSKSILEIYDIVSKIDSFSKLKTDENLDLIIKNFPLLAYCFEDKKYLIEFKYEIQMEPIILESFDKNKVISVIKFLLAINGDSGKKKNKTFVVLTIFDYIYRNFNIVVEHQKFAKTVYNKLNEIIVDDEDSGDVKNYLISEGYDPDTFINWKNSLDKYIQD